MKAFLCILLLFTCIITKAQDQSANAGNATALKTKLNQTISQFAKHAAYHPTEKIYLQLNKPWYNRADTIWFKAYTVTGNHKLTDLSEVAYVLLVNNRDSVLQRLNLKLNTGTASGHVALPPYITPGTYHLKAYTNWMRNEDESYIYDRPINIGGIAANPTTTTASQTDIQFFPEGGTLINGLRNRIAFKAVNPNGSPANITGKITASDGSTVAELQSGHDGIGVFTLTPQEGKTYKATIQPANGQSQTIQLPKALAEGYILTVNPSPDSLSIIIAANPQLFKNKAGHGFYLVVQAVGKIVYSVSSPLLTSVSGLNIPVTRLPSGIVRLTLFSETGEPLQERVAFIQRPDNVSMDIHSEKTSYAPYEKVNLSVSAGNAAGNFSAAVINETFVPADDETEPTIFSQLLLSSELHGVINNPAYYFKDKDEKTLDDLDMLMLTQGYRKLEWKKLLDTVNKVSPYFAEEGLSISGTIKSIAGKPVAKGNVSLFIPAQHIIAATTTDSIGRFTFAGINIIDTASVVLKASGINNDNNVLIYLDRNKPKTNPSSFFNEPPAIVTEAMKKAYANQEKQSPANKQLNEVTINDKKLNGSENPPWAPVLNHSDNLNGSGHANQVILGKDLVDCVHLTDCLITKIAGIRVYDDGQITEIAKGRLSQSATNISAAKLITAVTANSSTSPKAPPKNLQNSDVNPAAITDRQPFEIILDGAQVDANTINYLNVNNIYSIEVLRSGAYKNIYGTDAFGGVLLITTKRGSDDNDLQIIKKSPGMMSYVFNGYYKERSFYMPKYTATNSIVQDQRSAVYWNPDVITDKDGKTSLNFTNAGKGNYRVVIEGIDNDGHLGRTVYRYKVE